MSIPMSWISSANISSRRDITCDSDDFVLVHEDLAQLLACREQVWAFLAEWLRLSFTDLLAMFQAIRKGVDVLSYILLFLFISL